MRKTGRKLAALLAVAVVTTSIPVSAADVVNDDNVVIVSNNETNQDVDAQVVEENTGEEQKPEEESGEVQKPEEEKPEEEKPEEQKPEEEKPEEQEPEVNKIGIFKEAGTGKWYYNSKGWWYVPTGLSYVTNDYKIIDNKLYAFDNAGYMITGWKYLEGHWYYFDNTGAALRNQWKWIGNECYYFYEDGHMAANERVGAYWVNGSGAYRYNHWEKNSKGWWYVLEDESYVKSEFKEINGAKYYFLPSGYMATGWAFIENEWYLFSSSGAMLTGWQTVGGKEYYLYPEDGKMAHDTEIDGKKLCSSGAHAWNHWEKNSKGWWYELETGTYAKNEFREIGGVTYYFKSNGYMATGWEYVNSAWYYFNSSGKMVQSSWIKLGGTWYYLDADGKMKTGWFDVGNTTYCATSSGAMMTGLRKIDGIYYYFELSGALRKNSTVTYCGKTFNIDAEGKIDGNPLGVLDAGIYAVLDSVGYDLWSAYKWSASMKYTYTSSYIPAGWTEPEHFGYYGFMYGYGDCRVMAATFYWLAQALGYDSHYVKGYVPSRSGGSTPHSWVEIDMEGTTYVFDPDLESELGLNGYKIWYGKPGTWRYSNYYRVN